MLARWGLGREGRRRRGGGSDLRRDPQLWGGAGMLGAVRGAGADGTEGPGPKGGKRKTGDF